MIQFTKLRLSGFKSFVDKTELAIEPGLTGIVGPNGCGKSNLVEALRWVMGENSAKRMRSDGMEDVIFNGTSARPARNFAEVGLLLDNSSLSAPAAFNNEEEIEVTRKIERDQGSLYKINGKTCRARDVQMLFADTVSGANSPAIVSQGRITAIINAKPQDRRMILEESAGVSGLYARRHEAELRLRAADRNLQRIQDIVGSMEERFAALKKQARQAIRYKKLSHEIRQVDITIAWLEWKSLCVRIHEARSKFDEAESLVAQHFTTVTQLTKTQSVQSEDLPALRQSEAESSAALQAAKMALQRLEDQERDLENQLTETTENLGRLEQDRSHEQESLEESAGLLSRLEGEEGKIRETQNGEENTLKEKLAIKEKLESKVSKLEEDYEFFMEKLAENKASRQAIERQISADESRLLVTQERREALTEDLEKAKTRFDEDSRLADLKTDILALEDKVSGLRKKADTDEKALETARSALDEARENQQECEKKKSKILTEINMLESILNSDSQDEFRPVLEDMQPEKGFETALSRALGDTLMASTNADAPIVWLARENDLSNFPALPQGTKALEPHVKAPDHLKAALSLIGVVSSAQEGHAIAPQLLPGQSLVSQDGAYWRWDGLHIKQEASDRHALQLRQKNRLQDLRKDAPGLEEKAEKAAQSCDSARASKEEAQKSLDETQTRLRENEAALSQHQSSLNQMTEERSGLFARIAALEEGLRSCAADTASLEQSLDESRRALASYDEKTMEDQNAQIEKLRAALAEARDSLRESVREFDIVQQEQSRRHARLHAIADERVNLQNRNIRSRERLKELETREGSLKEKLGALKNRPTTITADREGLLEKIGQMEHARKAASDKLAEVETALLETNKALKEAENQMGQAREQRAHAQAIVSSGEEQLAEVVSSIEERFETPPEKLAEQAGLHPDSEDLPDTDALKDEKEKMIRSREMIGPVNLRAETESVELEKELSTILEERNDLMQAIEELRQGIATLNKEARERLLAAFDHVNSHFKRLFTQLYSGGQAHLELIESDDPLESGLEIFAQPPGKTLQSLSLLSGGEQTLASTALIFAMFLTNPSPICVLDEIDAPLDDANVDRVCDLLEEISERGETRFLIITHHRLTMARMDRLYGVTMAERGISQLVSVDLNQQMDFLEEAA